MKNMEWKPTVLFLWAMLSLLTGNGCDSSDKDPETGTYIDIEPGLHKDNTIIVGNVNRSYDYYLPDNLGRIPHPLIFVFHGGGSSPDDLTGESGFKAPYRVWIDLADVHKFIVVYPEGTINPKGALGWNDCRADASSNPSTDDVGFIQDLIERFAKKYNIDTSRIYATGTSNGGHMSLRLALELSDTIAAVGVIAAAMPRVGCSTPGYPISVLLMNGTNDPISPYEGGEVAPDIGGRGSVLSTSDSIKLWIDFNQTDTIPEMTRFADTDSPDSSTVTRYTYSNGLEGTQVVLYEVLNGGHTEPSIQEQYAPLIELYLGKQNHDIEMANEIWEFFQDKTL